MDLQNLAYALTQVVHNFGAVAVVGGSVYGRSVPCAQPSCRRIVLLLLIGWSAQAVSGMGFGAISYAYYRQLPDIHGIAVAALSIKIACALLGIALAWAMIRTVAQAARVPRTAVWSAQTALAVTALTAAAFLRWFS